MRLVCSFEFIDMDNETVAVPVGKNANMVNGILKLNKEGAEIVSLLSTDTTEKAIVEHLSTKYENTTENLLASVQKTLNILRDCHLLID